MKKQLTAFLLTFVLLLTMAGCSAAHAVQKLDAAEDTVEAKLDTIEDQVESTILEAVRPPEASAPTSTSAAPAQTLPASAKNPQELTKEQAQQIALEYLNLTADQVTLIRSEYEIDDGIPQYDVEFLQGDWEYEFEIHGETGQILSYDKDHKYD